MFILKKDNRVITDTDPQKPFVLLIQHNASKKGKIFKLGNVQVTNYHYEIDGIELDESLPYGEYTYILMNNPSGTSYELTDNIFDSYFTIGNDRYYIREFDFESGLMLFADEEERTELTPVYRDKKTEFTYRRRRKAVDDFEGEPLPPAPPEPDPEPEPEPEPQPEPKYFILLDGIYSEMPETGGRKYFEQPLPNYGDTYAMDYDTNLDSATLNQVRFETSDGVEAWIDIQHSRVMFTVQGNYDEDVLDRYLTIIFPESAGQDNITFNFTQRGYVEPQPEPEPEPIPVAKRTIYYTTYDNEVLDFSTNKSYWGGAELVSNRYVDGLGELIFDEVPTKFDDHSIKEDGARLKTIVFNDGMTDFCPYPFYYCRNLTELTLPPTLKAIPQEMCQYLTKLTSLTIPAGVTEVEIDGFRFQFTRFNPVPNIKNIYFLGQKEPDWYFDAKSNMYRIFGALHLDYLKGLTIHIPIGSDYSVLRSNKRGCAGEMGIKVVADL